MRRTGLIIQLASIITTNIAMQVWQGQLNQLCAETIILRQQPRFLITITVCITIIQVITTTMPSHHPLRLANPS
jgi:hypothetical protein